MCYVDVVKYDPCLPTYTCLYRKIIRIGKYENKRDILSCMYQNSISVAKWPWNNRGDFFHEKQITNRE